MKINLPSKIIGSVVLSCALPVFGGVSPDLEAIPVVIEKNEHPVALAFTAGYDSAYIFRGVNILDAATGGGGLVSGDLSVSGYGFTAGAWYGRSVNEGYAGNTYGKLDLYANYSRDIGPMTVTGGYIYYHFDSPLDSGNPSLKEVQTGSDTHELMLGLSTKAIPFLTPSLVYYYDFDLCDGGYLEFKIKSTFPIISDKVSLDPFALIAYDFGYNGTTDWNNFQAGIAVPWHVTEHVTLSGYGALNVAMNSVRALGGDDYEVFGGARITFSF